jgi:hypothetical protein
MKTFAVGLRRRHGLSILVVALGAALGFGPVAAGPPDSFPRRAGADDLELTLKVKSVLAADPALRDANPTVSIVDRRALVGGAMPSEAAISRATELVRAVPGLADVQVVCWVDTPEDPLKKLVADRLKADAKPARPGSEQTVLHDPRPAATVVAQRATPAAWPLLLDPVAPRSGRSASPPAYPTIPAPAVPVQPKQDLASAVDELRKADPRFAGLTATVRGDAVEIAGRAADGDAWDLAAAVRKVPGVARVSLGRID